MLLQFSNLQIKISSTLQSYLKTQENMQRLQNHPVASWMISLKKAKKLNSNSIYIPREMKIFMQRMIL